jgi:hypothetical protein
MVDGDTTTQTKKKAKKLLGIFGIGENWLSPDRDDISIDSFHSFDTSSNSIASSAINPIATLQEAKSYLDDLEAYMAKKPAWKREREVVLDKLQVCYPSRGDPGNCLSFCKNEILLHSTRI